MGYFDDILNDIKFDSTKKKASSKVRKILLEDIKRLNVESKDVLDHVDGHKKNKNEFKKNVSSVVEEITLLKRKQAEMTRMDKDTEDKMRKLAEEQASTKRESEKLQQEMSKLQTRMELFSNKSENACQCVRDKARLYRDLTGICWDYKLTSETTLQGYAQNKKTCLLKTFTMQSEMEHPYKSSMLLWRTLDEIVATK